MARRKLTCAGQAKPSLPASAGDGAGGPTEVKLRLEAVNNPETVFYNEENGKSAGFFVGFVLRTLGDKASRSFNVAQAQIKYELVFADTHEPVPASKVKGASGVFTVVNENDAVKLERSTLSTVAFFRVDNVISKKSLGKHFCVKASIPALFGSVSPVFTGPVEVRTKRKLVSKKERSCEKDVREAALARLVGYLNDFAPLAQLPPHQTPEAFSTPLLDLFQAKGVEEFYPTMPITYNSRKAPKEKVATGGAPRAALLSTPKPRSARPAKPSSAKPSSAKPSSAKPSSAKPAAHSASENKHEEAAPTKVCALSDAPCKSGLEVLSSAALETVAKLEATLREKEAAIAALELDYTQLKKAFSGVCNAANPLKRRAKSFDRSELKRSKTIESFGQAPVDGDLPDLVLEELESEVFGANGAARDALTEISLSTGLSRAGSIASAFEPRNAVEWLATSSQAMSESLRGCLERASSLLSVDAQRRAPLPRDYSLHDVEDEEDDDDELASLPGDGGLYQPLDNDELGGYMSDNSLSALRAESVKAISSSAAGHALAKFDAAT